VSSARPALPSKARGALRILFVGDVYGKPGVDAVTRLLPGLLRERQIDFCIANGENGEQGKGLTPAIAQDLFGAGVDVITGGNHSLYREKVHERYDNDGRMLRPFNFPEGTPGRGSGIFDAANGRQVAVLNLHGRAMLMPCDDPFRLGQAEIERLKQDTAVVIVDFHAEASAEKLAFARYVDGTVSAVIGTHTHVQTADECILEDGTAFITDAGMTGPFAGVIGMKTEHALHRFLYPMTALKSGVAEGDVRLSGVVIDIDPHSGQALAIVRVQERLPE
jgi:2',3'-cyclic-nucleotide 2'-phosphodiesterase